MLSIWDVRQGSMPVSLLNAHQAECKCLNKQDHNSNVVVTTRGIIFHHIGTSPVLEKISCLPRFSLQGNSGEAYIKSSKTLCACAHIHTKNTNMIKRWGESDEDAQRVGGIYF